MTTVRTAVTRCGQSLRSGSAAGPAALAWLAVYLLVVASGQKFTTYYLDFGWQLIPWDVLSTSPLTSVWYLHIQPPLWNLLLGLAAWSSPVSDAVTLQVVMAGWGMVAAASAAVLGHRLGLRRRASVLVALAATVHPEVLKGAFEPTYELAVGALLVTVLAVLAGSTSTNAVVAKGEPTSNRSRVDGQLIVVAALVTAVSMTRSLYHPLWAVLVVAIALWWHRRRITRRGLVVTMAIPVLVMGGWMIKNTVVFGQTNLSSWFGMNLQRAVIPVLDLEDLEAMHARGAVSDIAMIGPFGKYELYADVVDPCVPSRTHRALSEPMRTTDEWSPNFNYECYLPIYEQAGRDAWAVIEEHPGVWLEGRMWSLRSTVSVAVTPAQSPSIVMRSLDRVYSWARVDYAGVLSTRGWGTPIYGQLTAPVDFGLVLIPLYGGVVLAGFVPMLRRMRGTSPRSGSPVFIVASLTVGFTVVVGAIAELGEQARFRTMTDPLVVVIAAVVVAKVTRRLSARRRTP